MEHQEYVEPQVPKELQVPKEPQDYAGLQVPKDFKEPQDQ
jgi:hypothetical protein